MRRRGWLIALLTLAIATTMTLSACGQQDETAEPAKDQIEQQTEQKQQAVDDILNSAQKAVGELASAVGGLESRVQGLQINSDLQEIQRKLNNAIEEVGDKKVAALEELTEGFDTLIEKVDAAAAKLPEGGPVRTELEDFSKKLADIQADVADAAASYEASTTATP